MTSSATTNAKTAVKNTAAIRRKIGLVSSFMAAPNTSAEIDCRRKTRPWPYCRELPRRASDGDAGRWWLTPKRGGGPGAPIHGAEPCCREHVVSRPRTRSRVQREIGQSRQGTGSQQP